VMRLNSQDNMIRLMLAIGEVRLGLIVRQVSRLGATGTAGAGLVSYLEEMVVRLEGDAVSYGSMPVTTAGAKGNEVM